MTLTAVSLFSGAGGGDLGLEAAGIKTVALCEIEPHARAVLRRHWPDVPLHGDVTTLDGTPYVGVDIVVGGSPCQDLSIAGKRAGMTEGSGTRSSLFFDQIRVWKETQSPYLLWENVVGALSSNTGKDFAAVLSAIVGAAVLVPTDGWESAGVAAGPTGVASWRILDAQYFGVPQRRRRVFVLGARTGGVDPAQVLLDGDGVCGNPAPGGETCEGTASDAGRGAPGGCWPIDTRNATRTTDKSEQNRQGVGIGEDGDPSPTLTGMFVPAVAHIPAVNISNGEVAGALTARADGSPCADRSPNVVLAFHATQDPISGPVSPALGANAQIGALVMRQREGKPAGSNQHVTELAQIIPAIGRPRRLMPVECERLMGWPDGHTAIGIDEKGREYVLADTPRYKLCGNGIASPVIQWIGERLRQAVEGEP